jgi:endonuclease/exonuclease/phosphatase family metal-dependent hydrolase
MNNRRVNFISCLILGLFTHGTCGKPEKPIFNDLKIMSFNIRLGVANDGENHWDKRKELVLETIQNFGPDLLGLQEVWHMQEEYLKEKLSNYAYYGRSRRTKPREGEQCAVMFRKNRFEMVKGRTFWLSETPDVVESKSWDSSLPRIANWTLLRDKKNNQSEVFFINTHFDHKGKESRKQAALLLKRRIQELKEGVQVIITGDFNAKESSEPYQGLVSDKILDTYRTAYNNPTEEESTLSGWNGRTSGNRIDWVLCSRNYRVLSAKIDRTEFSGRYPSDHYPVTAILRPQK